MTVIASVSGGGGLETALKRIGDKLGARTNMKVGFLAGSTEPGGASTPMVAAIQEFGAPAAGIPPRPFFRTMVAAKKAGWGPELAAQLKNGSDASTALALVGEDIKADLRQSIIDLSSPPLSPVTLLLRERFGNSPESITFKDVQQARADIASGRAPKVTATQAHPLIWTGTMLDSIGSEVE